MSSLQCSGNVLGDGGTMKCSLVPCTRLIHKIGQFPQTVQTGFSRLHRKGKNTEVGGDVLGRKRCRRRNSGVNILKCTAYVRAIAKE